MAGCTSQAQREHAELELSEHKLHVENYPTDLVRKFELGKRYFAVAKYNEAIDIFQEAQADPKNRDDRCCSLGQSFLNIHWADEAIETFRRGLDIKDLSPEVQLDMRYWLMVALEQKGGETPRQGLYRRGRQDRILHRRPVHQLPGHPARREAIKKLLAELRATWCATAILMAVSRRPPTRRHDRKNGRGTLR